MAASTEDGQLEPAGYLDAIRGDGSELGRVARAASGALGSPVPSCPGWSMADLVVHITRIHRRTAAVLRHPSPEPPPRGDVALDVPEGPGLVDAYDECLRSMIEALEETEPETVVWSFTGTVPARFWFRRMAHETAVHRADAQLVTGVPTAVEPALAADGVDELLGVFLGRRAPTERLPGGTVHLHCHDVAGEWVVQLGPERVSVARKHDRADAAVRGPASALYLWSWGRAGREDLEVVGDVGAADRFREVVASAT